MKFPKLILAEDLDAVTKEWKIAGMDVEISPFKVKADNHPDGHCCVYSKTLEGWAVKCHTAEGGKCIHYRASS
jgi:hypothetical protein